MPRKKNDDRPHIDGVEKARLSPKERKRRKKLAKQKIACRVEGTEVYKLVRFPSVWCRGLGAHSTRSRDDARTRAAAVVSCR